MVAKHQKAYQKGQVLKKENGVAFRKSKQSKLVYYSPMNVQVIRWWIINFDIVNMHGTNVKKVETVLLQWFYYNYRSA